MGTGHAADPRADLLQKFQTAVKGKTSYYYVRGEQEDGEIVWASPMWITYSGK